MGERSGFFNAKLMADENGNPVFHEDGSIQYDREYSAAEFAALFSMLLTNGIRNGGDNLRVLCEGGNMNVVLMPGDAMINGYYYKLEENPVTFNIALASGYPRKDLVVLRLDLNEKDGRRIYADIKRGTPQPEPGPPALERNNEIYELALAEITVYSNTTVIYNWDIVDLRLEPDACGIISSLIEIDSTHIFEALDEFFQWTGQARDEFEGWFEEVKVLLWQSSYADFDNWVYKPGCVYITQTDKGRVTQRLISESSGEEIAVKSAGVEAGSIIETLWFKEPELHVKKTTAINGGIITSRVEAVQ